MATSMPVCTSAMGGVFGAGSRRALLWLILSPSSLLSLSGAGSRRALRWLIPTSWLPVRAMAPSSCGSAVTTTRRWRRWRRWSLLLFTNPRMVAARAASTEFLLTRWRGAGGDAGVCQRSCVCALGQVSAGGCGAGAQARPLVPAARQQERTGGGTTAVIDAREGEQGRGSREGGGSGVEVRGGGMELLDREHEASGGRRVAGSVGSLPSEARLVFDVDDVTRLASLDISSSTLNQTGSPQEGQ